MKLRYSGRLQRIWPLLFSMLALWGLVRIAPVLLRDFELSRDSVTAYGWYTELDQEKDYVQYAYKVEDQIYSGRVSWNDEDSDVYSCHPGDRIAIIYLAHKPWVSVSARSWDVRDFRVREGLALFYIFVFLTGIWLPTLRRHNTQASIVSA